MKLYDHQKRIIDDDKAYTGLWLGTGSAKTATALHLARGRTLVICPKTQRDDQNWQREKAKFGLTINITVLSKEDFRREHATLPPFETVIIDEADTCLGVTPNIRFRKRQAIPKASQLFEALDSYIERVKPSRLYLCTATITRSPMTVWAAAKILRYKDSSGQPWDFYAFRHRFYIRLPMPGREVWLAKSDEETKNILATLVRKLGYVGRLEDYFDVPPQTHRTIHLELTAKQRERIKQLTIEYPEPIVRVGKIHQVENGVLKGDEFSPAEEFENAKIDKIIELAEEFPKLVIFAKYTAQIEAIASALRKEFKEKQVFIMTGDTKNRGEILRAAEQHNNCAFIVQSQISAGWELKSYPTMIFASRTYSWADQDQALGRIQRSDAIKKNLYIYLVVKGGVDEAIDRSLLNKKDFSERVYLHI